MKKYNIPEVSISITLALSAALIFYFSTNPPQVHGDYTFRIAGALLRGELGLRLNEFPSFLSEMIPYEGKYYSAFPLGSVISMLPIALLFHEPPRGFKRAADGCGAEDDPLHLRGILDAASSAPVPGTARQPTHECDKREAGR